MLVQKDLNDMICGMPDCKHNHDKLYLHGRCHMSSGAEVAYNKDTGSIEVRCNTCKKDIAEILVAKSL